MAWKSSREGLRRGLVDYLGNKDTCEELSSIYLMPVEFSLEEGDEFIEWLRGEMFNV